MTAIAGFPNVSAPGASPNAGEVVSGRPRAYTAGFADHLGERQLAFDAAAGTSIEVLHFKQEFSDSPAFEAALRARVESLRPAPHSSLATILSVERTAEQGLSMVSKHTAGRRVSELVEKAHGPAFALELIRLVTPALVALQRTGDGFAHGVLSADRIIVTRDGRLVVVEHVLGSAVAALDLPRPRLLELGLAIPDGDNPIQLDGRSDLLQLGFVALSLLIGRHIDPADYPAKVPALFDEFVQSSRSPILAAKMRGWLERAMHLSPRPFASAREALDAFGDLPDDVDVRLAESTTMAMPADARLAPKAETKAKPAPALSPTPLLAFEAQVAQASRHESVDPIVDPVIAVQKAPARGFSRVAVGIIAGLALLAVGQAVALFALPYARPATEVVEIRPAAINPSAAAGAAALVPLTTPAGEPPATAAAAAVPVAAPAPVDAAASAAAPLVTPVATPIVAGSRFGGLTVTSPIDLQVFKDGKLLGSTSGPIAVNDGPHTLEFVNEALGFRFQQAVAVKSGQMTTVKVGVPNGRVSINALPWAAVTIDGTAHGETPLANLALPIGTHEIVFTHPQHGERKQTVVVKVDGLLRVTQTFDKD